MKKIYTILTGVALVAALASCSRKEEFKTVPYARLGGTEYTINENGGLLRIPVSVYDNDGGVGSVTFVVKDGTAVEGKDFTVEPASGVFNFNGNGTQYIEITIIERAGEFTGNMDFSASLTGVTGDLTLSPVTDCDITIADLDHPLADILGTYTAKGYGYNFGDFSYTLHLTNDPKDVTLVWCDWIMPFWYDYRSYGNGAVVGKVSEDHSTITFKSGQVTTFDVGYGNQKLYSGYYKDGYEVTDDDIVFTKVSEGVYETENGIVALDDYVWPSYGGYVLGKENGYKTTWTKQ